MIEIHSKLIERDSDGALFIRYTGHLVPSTLASGSISFASWDCEVGAGREEHDAARLRARNSVISGLAAIHANIEHYYA